MTSARSIAALSGSTLAAGFVGYCVYFDYKRRNDVDFRRALVKEQHKVRKAKQADAEKAQHAQKHKIQEAIQQIKNDTFAPRGQEESEAYFLQQVGAGEALAGQGPDYYVDAAVCLIKALKVYPAPADLLGIYQKTQPQEVMSLITTIFTQIGAAAGAGVRPGSGGPALNPSIEEMD